MVDGDTVTVVVVAAVVTVRPTGSVPVDPVKSASPE